MIISTLKHPNIVQYLSIRWHSGSAKLYMEYCEGGSLEDYIKKQKEYVYELPGFFCKII